MKHPLSFVFLLAALSACNANSTSDLDIVRGRPVSSSSPAYTSTVYLSMDYSSCTGTVIGERLILTAAHCVEGNTDPSRIKVLFHRNDPAISRTIDAKRVSMFKREGAAYFPQFDIAAVELKETVPAPFRPVEILRNPALLNGTTPVLLAGYGLIADDCMGDRCSGDLLETNTQFVRYYDKAHVMSLMLLRGDPKLGLGGACSGDSGGPAYVKVNDRWFLAGVTNGVSGGCDRGSNLYTFAGDYASWLQSMNHTLPVADAGLNPPRPTLPMLEQGPQQTRPTTWAGWVNYANHEDAAWYAMQAILDALSGYVGDLEKSIDVLYKPELTEKSLNSWYSLFIQGQSLPDLTPLKFFGNLERLTFSTAVLNDVRALDALPNLKQITFMSLQSAPSNLFAQMPQTVQRLDAVSFSRASSAVLQGMNWQALNGVKSLTLENAEMDMTPLSPLAVRELQLSHVLLRGTYQPQRAPAQVHLQSVIDSEGRAGLDWLGTTQDVLTLRLNRLPADSLHQLGAFTSLQTLSADNMRLTQTQIEALALPPTLRDLSVSGNAVEALPTHSSWQALRSIAAYDNPLIDASCPAPTCFFDAYLQPRSLREYCANAAAAGTYVPAYKLALLAILDQGELKAADCDRIETAATRVDALSFDRMPIDDIRPLRFLNDQLKILSLAYTNVEDLTPLRGMQRLSRLSLYGSKAKMDLTMFAAQLGLSITGIHLNPATQDCPIVGGECSFSYEGTYLAKNGPLLGSKVATDTLIQLTVTLPGQTKTFQAR